MMRYLRPLIRFEYLKYLIIESAFCKKNGFCSQIKASLSELIGRRAGKFEQFAEIFITHLKSSAKFSNALENINPYRLENDQLFEF